ncbi:MAG: acyl-CoA thioesterase-1 [Candidatus Azotimanducaceae bacterium]|jgi:acyl-CoA thioesterase-1
MKIIISLSFVAIALASYFFFVPKDAWVQNIDRPIQNTEVKAAIQIIAFGDSLTAGLGLSLSDSYPAQLETALREQGFDVDVINSGVSGETTAGNLTRAQFIRDQNPDIVILGIGGNDALRFLPIENARENIRVTLTTLLSGESPPEVLLLSMQAPSNAGVSYKQSFDSIYPTLATEFSIPLAPFIVDEVSRNPNLLQADGIHPTAEGYTVLIDNYLFSAIMLLLTK